MESNPFIQKSSEARKCKVIGFNRRLVAALLDGLILLTGTFILVLVVGLIGVYLNIYSNDEIIPVDGLVIICGLLLSVFYYVVAWSKSGQTIAKNVLGIKVVGSDGQPLSVGRALLRYLGYIISALPLSLGFLWIVFDHKRQGWHDKIASSYAIDSGMDIYGQENLEFVPADSKTGWVWLLVWLLFVMVMPAVLLGSLFILGPSIGRIITNLLVN